MLLVTPHITPLVVVEADAELLRSNRSYRIQVGSAELQSFIIATIRI